MTINIVVAFTWKTFGIGKDGKLPWNIPEDLSNFYKLTKDTIVVMGANTYFSIPEDKRPLKNRWNIVLTSKPHEYKSTENVQFVSEKHLDELVQINSTERDIFIIGGSSLYEKYMPIADNIYATIIEKEFNCDTFFPVAHFEHYEIIDYSLLQHSENENCNFRFVTYQRTNAVHGEYAYLDLMKDIMNNGGAQGIRPDRTGVGTFSVFARQLRFDLSKSVPILTTKFLAWKTVLKELLWFLKGQTDSKILESQGVNIWKANTTREFLDNRGLTEYEEGDTGPLYSTSFRAFNCEYKGCKHDHIGEGFDQITNLIEGLKNDPYSRRHLLTTFNPAVVSKCVLAPCHGIAIQFYVSDDDDGNKHLSCHVYCRSSDTFLGLSFNIASYSMFTCLIAKMCDMIPKELIVSTGDTHIYNNHFKQVLTQMKRYPLPFPILEINDNIKEKKIEELSVDDFNLIGYIHHPAIKADMAV